MKETLTTSDPCGWYECRVRGPYPLRVCWWTGSVLHIMCDDSPVDHNLYTDFLGPLAPPPNLSALARELHAEIMDRPIKPLEMGYAYNTGYAQGHRDARHAAAELILSRLSPAAGMEALTPDNLNADLAHRLSCVAHDCCVNGRMRHDVGLKLAQVVREFKCSGTGKVE